MSDDIVKQLRERACPAGKPWTGDAPEEDHGHTDCWLHLQSAKEIERLRTLITEWADAEDEADMIRGIDLFTAYEALRKAVGR
jgi:hypothetical protein